MNACHGENTYTREELGNISIYLDDSVESDDVFDAINHLSVEFGKDWIQSAGGRYHIHFTEAWQNWSVIRELAGAESIMLRWKEGFDCQGVLPEIRILAALKRVVHSLELFPSLNNRILDCRYKCLPESRWIYTEISKRGESERSIASTKRLEELAEIAHSIANGRHAHIALLREISEEEHLDLLSWLTHADAEIDIPFEYARFGFTQLTSEPSKPICNKEWANSVISREAHRPCTYVGKIDSESVGTAYSVVDDFNIERYFRQESEQLQHGVPGILIFDVTDVSAGLEKCVEIIKARLQPSINTRVSAVALVNASFKEKKMQYQGHLLMNEFAKFTLMEDEVRALVAAFE